MKVNKKGARREAGSQIGNEEREASRTGGTQVGVQRTGPGWVQVSPAFGEVLGPIRFGKTRL